MRVSRLLELLVMLQLRGGASATELASALDVSIRTVYRDVDALCAAGVPIHTEVGRHGGIRIDPSYRVAGLPRLEPDQARSLLFAVVPTVAHQLGFDVGAADRTLLPAMEPAAESAARVVRDRLLVEPTHWFVLPDETPALGQIAAAVWECHEVRMTYRGADVLLQPLGLILKGDKWYVLGQSGTRRQRSSGKVRDADLRLFRLSRIDAVEVLAHRFERPTGFDLAAVWAQRRQAFMESLPLYQVHIRVSPEGESLLSLLDEGAPTLPLPVDVSRDSSGWAHLHITFERSEAGAARHLLRLGADVEVVHPPELRSRMSLTVKRLRALYRD
jgi:predicted DNA-binding transcriptional regulator YafY